MLPLSNTGHCRWPGLASEEKKLTLEPGVVSDQLNVESGVFV